MKEGEEMRARITNLVPERRDDRLKGNFVDLAHVQAIKGTSLHVIHYFR
jgi:hypothetical protein